jgi:hypothetical protein
MISRLQNEEELDPTTEEELRRIISEQAPAPAAPAPAPIDEMDSYHLSPPSLEDWESETPASPPVAKTSSSFIGEMSSGSSTAWAASYSAT